MKLLIAKLLSLPTDVVTQVEVIIAKRRVGKSYTMRRITEQLLKAKQQVVIVDPKGDQWGIRSSADGKKPGFPVLILGGEHGDLPLEASGGELVAKLVVEERVSILLDLSQFRKYEVAKFMTDFLENLYRLKAQEKFRTPVKLVVDEADAIAPQKPQKGEERMLGAIEDIVRRGGQRGIGCTLVTQRSAVLNKNVLTQAQILVVLRTIAPQDLKAIKEWIDVHGTVEEGKELMDSLPSLPIGDAWFWSPGWPTEEGIFKRVHVLPIETFDSGATPKPGEKKIVPKNLADVDLKSLEKQMAATIEKAKQDDPTALRKEVARLKAELAKALKGMKPTTPDEVMLKRTVAAALAKRDEEWAAVVSQWKIHTSGTKSQLVEMIKTLTYWTKEKTPPEAPGKFKPGEPTPDGKPLQLARHDAGFRKRMEQPYQPPAANVEEGELPPLKDSAIKILTVLVSRHPIKLTRAQLATLSGMSARSSSFDTHMSALKRHALIEKVGDSFSATQAGIDHTGGEIQQPGTPEEVREMWKSNLKDGAWKILEYLIETHDTSSFKTKEEIAAGVEPPMSINSSSFDGHMSVLKRNGLIEPFEAGFRATDILF